MPRIRTIKPEFFRSPDTASATPVARLLYIAMWCWADDFGRGEADLKALEGFAFPNDDVRELSGGTSENFRHVLTEVVETFGVVLYIANGRPYYLIPSWGEHQRNERSAKPKYPGPDDGVTCTVEEIGGNRRKFRRTLAEAPRSSGPGTGEQGNRGTGEKEDRPPVLNATSLAIARDRKKGGVELARHLNATARTVQAADIADVFSRSLETPLETGVVIKVGIEIDKCLKSEIPPPAIATGLRAWLQSDSWSPTQIPTFVAKANRSTNNGAGKPTRKAVGYQEAADALLAEVETLA